MNNELEKELLKAQIQKKINQKLVDTYGHCFKPYLNKDDTPSWQVRLDELLAERNSVREIFIPAANSSGKTKFLAYLIVSILNGTHPICNKFLDRNSIHIHCILDDKGVQKTTIQVRLEEITNGEISARGFGNRDKYKFTSHNEVFTNITHRGTSNYVTFGSLKEGSTGNVGIRPQILLSDEPCSEEIYNELCVRTTEKNTVFIMCATVINNKHGWIINKCKDILQNPVESRRVITARMLDNPYVPQETIDHLKEVFGEDSTQYKVRVLGELTLVDGLVLNGIEKCIVPNNYIPEDYQNKQNDLSGYYDPRQDFIWAESWDFGVGAKDPTLVGFFKCYTNGLVVQEDEICLYEKTLDDWVEVVLKKRYELDMDYYIDGTKQRGAYLDPKLGIEIRKPTICVGDKIYLCRKAGVNTSSRIKSEFAKRHIFIQPASGERVELGIPIIQSFIKNKHLLIKERCVHSIDMGKNWVMKVSDKDGKVSYASPHDHYGDILRYLFEKLPSNSFVDQIKANEVFMNNQKINTIKSKLTEAKLKYNF